MRWDLVIFDCDGVLVDSEPLSNQAFADCLAEIGFDIGYDEVVRRFVGRSNASCLAEVEAEIGQPLPEDFAEHVLRRTLAALEEVQPVPGVREALEALEHPFCVASSGDPRKMRLTLGKTGLLPFFEGRMFSAVEVAHGKPAPDLFLHAAASLGASPRRCIVIEDSLPGIQAARAAEMQVLGFARGEQAAALRQSGARLFDSMAKLPSILTSWNS
jgi:HAD superfamily hydrolase (TIGR01509 family)